MSRRRRLILAVVGAAALAALVAAGWRLVLRDTAAPATVADAVARYRERAEQGPTAIPAGVYRYRTTGFESVSALGGKRHAYPTISTITVTAGPCGMELRFDALQGRHTTWQICEPDVPTEEAPLLVGDWVEVHTFFGRPETSSWRCSPAPWLAGPDALGSTTSRLCDDGDTTLAGEVTVIGAEVQSVAGTTVEVVHIRFAGTEDGIARGPFVEERWVERTTGLPVRLLLRVRTDNTSPIGTVKFAEQFDLRLLSLEATR